MRIGRIVMGSLYVVAGTAHFVLTRVYVHVMPAYLPAPHALVLISGAAEIAGGVGVLMPEYLGLPTRRAAAWGIILLLIAVAPVNVWMAQHPELTPGVPQWMLWVRVPLQLPLIWWAWMNTTKDKSRLGRG
jgi:uncharacterized membrane protein